MWREVSMEPFKALTLVAASAVISLVTAGAAGFYAGYSAGRGNLAEIKTYLADAPVSVASGSGGAPVSLKPVTDEIRALSARIEALAAEQPKPVAAAVPADASASAKPVLDEIRALSRQLDGVKADVSKSHAVSAPAAPALERAAAPTPDYSDALTDIREQVRGLALKMDKQEPKAPKALVDEIRSLSTAVQAQDSGTKRVVEEVRTGFASLQNAEPKTPKALVEEVRAISATISAQAAKPQVSVVDQIKILQASIESLKARLASGQSGGATSDGADLAQIRQLLLAATEQFGKCQTQLASYSAPASAPVAQTVSAPAAAAISVSPSTRQEPAAVVFYDNVMLKKDQEKQYDEIGVRLALQAIGPKQVKVAVNRQGFGLAFGERKVFRSQDVECEINLMETNLNEAQARVSLSCKR
jgi:hypothetical protein